MALHCSLTVQVVNMSSYVPVIDCGVPEEVPGSDFIGQTTTTYGSIFTIQCKPSYTQVGGTGHDDGDTTVECGADGYWGFGDILCEGEA